MIWLIAATLCAFFIKGLCGFANTLVFTTMLGFTSANVNISPMEVMLGYPSNLILAWRDRKHLKWTIWLPLSLMVITGSIPGVFILKNANAGILKLVFGIVIVLIGIEMMIREYSAKNSAGSKTVLFVIGILSGLLCGMFGIGAFLAAYVNRVAKNTQEFKANISVVFFVENTLRIILYTMTGIITLTIFKNAVLLMPFMLLGVFAGMRSGAILDEKLVKKIVIVMLMLSGAAIVIRQVGALIS